MKKLLTGLLALTLISLFFVSCETKKDEQPPELPPYESMVTDFGKFTEMNSQKSAFEDLKSATTDTTRGNYQFAAIEVGIFNIILTVTLAIPVASFGAALNNEAVFLGDGTWQWSYDVDGFASTYTARLTGQVRAEDIKWEMYLTKAGINGHPEFLWYEGTSDLDGNGGQWILNHSYAYPNPLLQIDWEKTGDEVGEIKYTNVRELTNAGEVNPEKGGYIQAGKTENDLDAYYNIHVYNANQDNFIDVNIEWSSENYYGRVYCQEWFGDTDMHCWDNQGYDTSCD